MPKLSYTLLLLAALGLAAPAAAQDPPPGPDGGTPEKPDDPPAPPAAPPGGPEALDGVAWFPLHVGRRWNYKVNFSIESTSGEAQEPENAPHVLDVYVAEPQLVDGRQVAVLEWKLDNELAQRCFFVTRDAPRPAAPNAPASRALYCVKRIQGFGEHMKEFTLVDAQETAREDLQVGDEWTWVGKAGPTPGRQTFKVVREEDVTTNAGTFHCLVVEIEFNGEDESHGVTTRWLARGVGIVREVSKVQTATSVFRTEGTLHRYEGGQ